jgi:hypothetical protein
MAITPLVVKDGAGTNQNMTSFQDAASNQLPAVTLDHGRAVYRASILYTLAVATPTAVVVLQGSASKTIRIKRIGLQGWSTTSGVMKFKLSRRSTAGTVGSAVLTAIPTQGKNDTNSAASSLTISTVGTANYTTLGTLTSILACGVVGFNKAADTNAAPPVVWPHGYQADAGQAFVLRGTSDWLTVDGGADAGGDAVPAGGILCFECEWEEDAS